VFCCGILYKSWFNFHCSGKKNPILICYLKYGMYGDDIDVLLQLGNSLFLGGRKFDLTMPKKVIWSRKSKKNRQCNWQMKKRKNDEQWSTKLCTKNYRMNNTNALKTWSERMCSRKVTSSCSYNNIFVLVLFNSVISHG
jgi:hypothetical protein